MERSTTKTQLLALAGILTVGGIIAYAIFGVEPIARQQPPVKHAGQKTVTNI